MTVLMSVDRQTGGADVARKLFFSFSRFSSIVDFSIFDLRLNLNHPAAFFAYLPTSLELENNLYHNLPLMSSITDLKLEERAYLSLEILYLRQ